MNDFIEIFEDVFPEGFCEHVIHEFDNNHKDGLTFTRQEQENVDVLVKNDTHMFLNYTQQFNPFEGKNTVDIFYEGIQKCFNLYTEKYTILRDVGVKTKGVKLQKTHSGAGYHVWHAEQGNGEIQASRCLVYIVYLNSLEPENCGETEFLYQQKRVRPVKNTVAFWPAAFTHPHRGNPVYGDATKYIATGWFNCV